MMLKEMKMQKVKLSDINSEYFLIVDHKGKQVWKDWNFKEI